MNVPQDISLAKWIRQLIKQNNIMKFYKTREWQELKEEVLYELHYECQGCVKNGEYTRADVVHHVNHVRERPDLALSKYYTDAETGETKRNLLPLCNRCHALEHDNLGEMARENQAKKFNNEEKW